MAAAIEGFELTLNTGAVDVAAGSIDGVHVDALAGIAGASSGGVELIVVEGGTLNATTVALADQTDAQTPVGSATDDGAGTLSAPELTHRGRDADVSADE